MMQFTAHNILLSSGEKTIPGDAVLLSESALWKSIVKTTDLFLPSTREERSRMRVADLGCLEGGYAVEFAKLGFQTLGIEARQDNLDKCNFVKSNLQLSNLEFVKDDVRNIENYGRFDIVLCYGLLYHLNDPVSFIRTLNRVTKKLLLLSTHYAPFHDVRYSLGFINNYFLAPLQKRTHFLERTKNYRLSAITEHEGYPGRWFREWSATAGKKKIERLLWASYNNSRSFWLTKKALISALADAGFPYVFEQFDYTGNGVDENYAEYFNRGMFVCLKNTQPAAGLSTEL